jgi:hypothetical protein
VAWLFREMDNQCRISEGELQYFVVCSLWNQEESGAIETRRSPVCRGSEPVSAVRHPANQLDAHPFLSRSRLTLNEQLSLFEPANEVRPSEASVGSWAALALALVILPWVLVGWMIWVLV